MTDTSKLVHKAKSHKKSYKAFLIKKRATKPHKMKTPLLPSHICAWGVGMTGYCRHFKK